VSEIETFGCGVPSLKLGSIVPGDHYFNEFPELYVEVPRGKQKIRFNRHVPSTPKELNQMLVRNVDILCQFVGGESDLDDLEFIKERMELCDEGGLNGAIYRYNSGLAGGNWYVYAITNGYA